MLLENDLGGIMRDDLWSYFAGYVINDLMVLVLLIALAAVVIITKGE